MSDNRTTKQLFQQAHDLITAQRYQEARKLLQQIDDPQAKLWLKQLDDKQKQSTRSTLFSPMMLLIGISGIVILLGIILGFMYVPGLIEALQPNTATAFFDETTVSDDEIIYAQIAGYCYHITGYGGELCLDWTDLVMADYHSTAVTCMSPYMESAILEDEDYITIRDCLSTASIPDPL